MDQFSLLKLNDEQILAANYPGSVFLTACPGSGKTRTLTYKIAIELQKISSHRDFLVAITYTHRAADEIMERVENLGLETKQLWVGTIHSFCLEWILKPYSIYVPRLQSGYSIINQPDADAILDDICKELNGPKITSLDCGYFFQNDKPVPISSDKEKHENIKLVLKKYFRTLRETRKIDFELILYFSAKLLREHPPIASALSALFRLVLIDEYQDTKEIQYQIVCSIFKAGLGKTKAFIVGDPNQAIFKTLGGYPIEIQHFRELSGLAITELSLVQNYRSSSKIIDYYAHFSLSNINVIAASDEKDYPSLITYNTTVSAKYVEDEIVRLVRYSLDNLNIEQSQICIIGPQWQSLAPLTRRLMTRLPQCDFDGPGMVPFGREIDNFWYKLSKICLSEPAPDMYIRRLRWSSEVLSALSIEGFQCSHSKSELLKLLNEIQIHERKGMSYLTSYFEEFLRVMKINIDHFPGLKNHHLSFFENANRKIEKARQEGNELLENIESFKRVFRPRTGITISTIHGVKGAEFDNIIAYSLLQGVVPHYKDPEQLKSANKLLYVIMSRARKNIFLISEAGKRNPPTVILKGYNHQYSPPF
ncbi:UvrD-helicase domain-containing protein [Pseudomonas fragi]|uniref:UvrD-helicase domain-containing protein n=1 Tax=Pseudomonas fragi TaxID=296 RepID=UPI001474A037|nr:ATP-dependent helicase [Pseudomonas fragi]NNB55719.1 ATP-dependent helicase [Pseudomonas fragi]